MTFAEYCKTNRATGRTTRMIEEALRLVELGEVVQIFSSSPVQSADLKRRFGEEAKNKNLNFSYPPDRDFELWLSGYQHEDRTILVDHHLIESRLGFAFDMLHRFDQGKEEPEEPTPESEWAHELYGDREDGLAHCKVCGGVERELPTDCPRSPMSHIQQKQVSERRVDFVLGKWILGAHYYRPFKKEGETEL